MSTEQKQLAQLGKGRSRRGWQGQGSGERAGSCSDRVEDECVRVRVRVSACVRACVRKRQRVREKSTLAHFKKKQLPGGLQSG
eukprot:3482878-Pleurochrysis_carterae.AAC.1